MTFTQRRGRRSSAVLATLLAGALLAGCGGAAPREGGAAPSGAPQAGGTATFIVPNEPPNLDPASFNNSYATYAVVGNALYGQLLRNHPVTGEIEPGLAESLSTQDGTTWTLTLRPGLTFSDGTAFDAAAVAYNWARLKDPKIATATNVTAAALIAEATAVDPTTLTFTLSRPSSQFGQDIVNTAMTFIASPTALAAGPEAFTANPVGAGPFVLNSWLRQDRMVLDRNPGYADAPQPYLDELVLRADPDQERRLTALQAGEADLVVGTSDEHADRAEQSGLVVTRHALSGTNMLLFNTAKPPFDDLRARQAVSAAVDLQAINAAVYGGSAEVPATLMAEQSPFYEPDLTLPSFDRERAQQLFDELAAEGKPVSLTIVASQASDARKVVESVQAQLATFRNVSSQIEAADFSAYYARMGSGDYDLGVFGVLFVDPEPSLSRLLTSTSSSNFARIADPALDEGLAVGRTSQDAAARKAAYHTVQERIRELVPFIGYARPPVSVLSTTEIGGVAFYGQGSPRVDELWKVPSS